MRGTAYPYFPVAQAESGFIYPPQERNDPTNIQIAANSDTEFDLGGMTPGGSMGSGTWVFWLWLRQSVAEAGTWGGNLSFRFSATSPVGPIGRGFLQRADGLWVFVVEESRRYVRIRNDDAAVQFLGDAYVERVR